MRRVETHQLHHGPIRCVEQKNAFTLSKTRPNMPVLTLSISQSQICPVCVRHIGYIHSKTREVAAEDARLEPIKEHHRHVPARHLRGAGGKTETVQRQRA